VAFAEMLSLLISCAGNPLLATVAQSATAAQQQRYPRAPAVTEQKLSNWRRGINLPHKFESIEFVLIVLIGEARKKKTPPKIDGLYDLRQWKKWWTEARAACTAPSDEASELPQPAGIPATTCPYQGLAAYQTTDQDRFFGRARAVKELMALITKVRTTDPGIVLLTAQSGAGKSSLLSAGLIPALSSGALNSSDGQGDWVPARMTPSDDPMAELARCLDQPDIKERAEGVGLLLIVDQAEQLFTPKVSAQSRAEFLDVLHTMSQPSMPRPAMVVMSPCAPMPSAAASTYPNSPMRCNPAAWYWDH
jgi:Novel STAND NTPase 1